MDKKGCSIFDTDEFKQLTGGLQLAKCMLKGKNTSLDSSEESISKPLELLIVADAHSCSCCGVQFNDLASQRAHFKLDWHRFNLKRQLAGFSSVREEAFELLADKDDMESISGSESESEDDEKLASCVEESTSANQSSNRHAKVFFSNETGQVISLYHCILSSNKDPADSVSNLVKQALEIKHTDSWAIIMIGGGHFAAGIFKGKEALVHKTFHCYTVRAKQGGSQSSRDNRGGSHPKSAGASLRRYNELSLIQHVQEIILSWDGHLKSCSLIFYRAVGPQNRSVLFGGKTPPLNKTDQRLRRIPFPTRRATYSEVQRVHAVLSVLEVHGPEDDFQLQHPSSPQKSTDKKSKNIQSELFEDMEPNANSPSRKGRSHGKPRDRAKSRSSPERPIPFSNMRTSSDSEDMSGAERVLDFQPVELNLDEALKEFDCSVHQNKPSKKQDKSKQKSKTKSEVKTPMPSKTNTTVVKEEIVASDAEKKSMLAQKKEKKAAAAALRKQQEEEEAAKDPIVVFQRALSAALQSNSLAELQACLSANFVDNLPAPLPGGLKEALNLPVTAGNTALHIASKSGQNEMIRELLLAGANPCVKNKKSQPPYVVAMCKETKSVFADFMIAHPNLHDYTDSQIPLPITEEQVKANLEKKAAQMKAKRARDKERRKVEAEQRAEQEEKDRFLALSDREKRALAAEKRILAAQKRGAPDEKAVVLARCFTCAVDITGKVPFEYEQYRFCSFDCLKVHRMKLKKP